MGLLHGEWVVRGPRLTLTALSRGFAPIVLRHMRLKTIMNKAIRVRSPGEWLLTRGVRASFAASRGDFRSVGAVVSKAVAGALSPPG